MLRVGGGQLCVYIRYSFLALGPHQIESLTSVTKLYRTLELNGFNYLIICVYKG